MVSREATGVTPAGVILPSRRWTVLPCRSSVHSPPQHCRSCVRSLQSTRPRPRNDDTPGRWKSGSLSRCRRGDMPGSLGVSERGSLRGATHRREVARLMEASWCVSSIGLSRCWIRATGSLWSVIFSLKRVESRTVCPQLLWKGETKTTLW